MKGKPQTGRMYLHYKFLTREFDPEYVCVCIYIYMYNSYWSIIVRQSNLKMAKEN